MSVSAQQLMQHYAALSDEELQRINPVELTEVAQKCYKDEIQSRGISVSAANFEEEDGDAFETSQSEQPDWTDGDMGDGEPFVVCAFTDDPNGSSVNDADEAYRALKAAGVPCRIEVRTVQPDPVKPRPYTERQLMVPSSYILHATSVLDQNFFNVRQESDWQTHLESLTDQQLLRLNVDDICAGLLDRATRLRNAYLAERRRRAS
jgi:hypothetical protein